MLTFRHCSSITFSRFRNSRGTALASSWWYAIWNCWHFFLFVIAQNSLRRIFEAITCLSRYFSLALHNFLRTVQKFCKNFGIESGRSSELNVELFWPRTITNKTFVRSGLSPDWMCGFDIETGTKMIVAWKHNSKIEGEYNFFSIPEQALYTNCSLLQVIHKECSYSSCHCTRRERVRVILCCLVIRLGRVHSIQLSTTAAVLLNDQFWKNERQGILFSIENTTQFARISWGNQRSTTCTQHKKVYPRAECTVTHYIATGHSWFEW